MTPDEFEMWKTHHLEQAETAVRETRRRAIRAHLIARWVYVTVMVLNGGIAIFVLIDGRMPVVSLAGFWFAALFWWLGERRLHEMREPNNHGGMT